MEGRFFTAGMCVAVAGMAGGAAGSSPDPAAADAAKLEVVILLSVTTAIVIAFAVFVMFRARKGRREAVEDMVPVRPSLPRRLPPHSPGWGVQCQGGGSLLKVVVVLLATRSDSDS